MRSSHLFCSTFLPVFFSVFTAFSTSVFAEQPKVSLPLRVVSAGSTMTELLYALEADQYVVGVDLTSRHYLKENEDKPVLGYHRQLSSEGVLALSPTHLIGSTDMGPNSTLSIVGSAGVSIQTLPTGNNFNDFLTRLDTLATLTKTESKAQEIRKYVNSALDQLNNNKPETAPRVIFVMASKNRPLTVAGSNTTIDHLMELAGGINPVASKATSYKSFSAEAVLGLQPDYLLISARSIEQHGGIDALLAQHPLLKLTPAYKHKRLIPVPSQAILGGLGLSSLEFAQQLNAQFQTRTTTEIASVKKNQEK